MAVSGRKFSDLHESVSSGSDGDIEKKCDSCFTIDKDKIDKQTIATKDIDECTEKCPIHKKEIIKFFCVNHEALGCNDCMVMHHRACTLDYIPDKCTDVGDSEEYRDVVRKLDQRLKATNDLTEQAVVRNKEIESCFTDIIKEITKFRKEIHERLDQLEEKLLTEAKNMMTTDKQTVQRVLDSCSSFISDIKTLQSSLHDEKAANQSGQLYITVKRAQSNLKSDGLKKNEDVLEESHAQYKYELNKDLENILKQEIFGKIDRHPLKSSLSSNIKKKGDYMAKAKLCTITKWPDYSGFGFSVLDSQNGTEQFVSKVDDNSPAKAAGLVGGERIVEVEGVNIKNETHEQVIRRIKAAGNTITLLLVDEETEKYYSEKKMVISSKMPGIVRLKNAGRKGAEKKK